MPGSNKKRGVRELRVEPRMKYIPALRAYDAAITECYADADAAAATSNVAGHVSPADQGRPLESASPAASAPALNLQFSHSLGVNVEPEQPG